MKKIFYAAFAFVAMVAASCSNDDIIVETDNSINEVSVTVQLSNFYKSYDYNDTRHDINVTDDYRTFNSEHDYYIQVRTLFYNEKGKLIDSLVNYQTNTNAVTNITRLPKGRITAISIVNFSIDDKWTKNAYWSLVEPDDITTAQLKLRINQTRWAILSMATQQFDVYQGEVTRLNIEPEPVGALAYLYMQNFQYKNESSYGTVSDNGIRSLCVYTQNKANGIKLDPNAIDKYVYLDDAGRNRWYYLSSFLEPDDFNKDWTYYMTNLYSYFYILAPNPRIVFGLMSEGDDGFTAYGEKDYSIVNGQAYLAYWDYFTVGEPYFGVATNNRWHSYDASRSVKHLSPLMAE